MKVVANIISILLHPLLMVTYGVIMAVMYTYLAVYPDNIKWFLVGGVFLSTALVPGLLVLLLVKSGGASDLELTNRRERVVPYLIFILSDLICLFFLYRMNMPFWLRDMILGVCVALFLALCINFYWKISVHAIGIGGLLGGVMGVCQIYLMNPYWIFILLITGGGLLGTSRVILSKHTPLQVLAGFGMGFMATYLFTLKDLLFFLFMNKQHLMFH